MHYHYNTPLLGADLGFYEGRCPIHLKGAPEVECRTRQWGRVWGGAYVKMVSFYAFPEIFIDSVTGLTTCFECIFFHIFFSKKAC